jgi:hypothetical protein
MPSFEYYKGIINRQERFNKRCCHLSDPVLSVRPGSKCPNTRHVDVIAEKFQICNVEITF